MALPVRRTETGMMQWDPLDEFTRLTQQLSGLFDERWPEMPTVLRGEGFTPLADLEETDDAYVVDVELPGVKKEDIAVEVVDRRLVITGERREQQRTGRLRQRARAVGRFHYEVILPGRVDENRIEASLHEGVLHLMVPKDQTSQHRKIEVK